MSHRHPMPIPNQLRRYRKMRGLKQKEVARLLGLKSASMISRWEAGLCLPSSLNVFRLAVVYRTMVDALFLNFLKVLKNEITRREELITTNKLKLHGKPHKKYTERSFSKAP